MRDESLKSEIADMLNARVLMFIGSVVGACANASVLIAPGSTATIDRLGSVHITRGRDEN